MNDFSSVSCVFFFFKQKTAYEMRISDWSSDVCSSDLLARFAAITDKAALSKILGEQTRADVDPLNATDFGTENLFGIFVTQGLATPGEVIPYMLQGGLGLPEREYYLSADPTMAEIRTDYQAYSDKLLLTAGMSDELDRAHVST